MSSLIHGLATTERLEEVFSDRSLLQAMLAVEVALARAEARAGLIPEDAARDIASVADAGSFDANAIAIESRQSATAVIPFVKALTARVHAKDPRSAGFVHWGATSQDVADTALVLLVKRALVVLEQDHERLRHALLERSTQHAGTVMVGRTLLQPAVPITFGLKVAGWFAAVVRGWGRVSQTAPDALVVQFGGAAGTLAALGVDGGAIALSLGEELDLPCPDAPWHTHRDRLAALLASIAIYTGTLGKMARDVSLLMQAEVGEVAEPGGGSSAMPNKRNPAGSATVLAAATRVPALLSSFLTGMVQEHERSIGGWHAEWPTVVEIVKATGAALASMATTIEGLTVSADTMRRNIEQTRGTIFAERAVMMLAGVLERDSAQRLVQQAVERSRTSGRRLAEELADTPEVTNVLTPELLASLENPAEYLGSAEALRRRLLGS